MITIRELLIDCNVTLAELIPRLEEIRKRDKEAVADCVANKRPMPNNYWIERVHLENKIRAIHRLKDELERELGESNEQKSGSTQPTT